MEKATDRKQEQSIFQNDALFHRAERKKKSDAVVKGIFMAIAIVCASIIVFVVVFVFIKGISSFVTTYTEEGGITGKQNFWTFLSHTTWNGGAFNFGGGYLIVNTIFLTLLSLILSIPLSILTSLLITRIAPKAVSAVLQAGVELLAAVPSVIYGLFGVGFINPLVNGMAEAMGMTTKGGNSVLSAIVVLALMSVPTMTMMATTAMKAVSKNLINASIALGASPTQTNFKIVLKDAQSGIFAGIILGIGRALGEATAVQMVIGNAPSGIHFGLFESSSTLTTQMLMGIGEATPGTLGYDIRFSAGLFLILLILVVDLTLNHIKNWMYATKTGQKMKPSLLKMFFTRYLPMLSRKLVSPKEESHD